MAAKANTKAKARKLPSFFNLANKKFVVLLVVVIGAVGVGSWRLYSTSAATDGKQNFPSVSQCNAFQPVLYEGVRNQAACTKTVQRFLRVIGFDAGPIDGIFGPRTGQAVWDYKYWMRMPRIHKTVDSETWGHFMSYCWNNSQSSSTLHNICWQ